MMKSRYQPCGRSMQRSPNNDPSAARCCAPVGDRTSICGLGRLSVPRIHAVRGRRLAQGSKTTAPPAEYLTDPPPAVLFLEFTRRYKVHRSGKINPASRKEPLGLTACLFVPPRHNTLSGFKVSLNVGGLAPAADLSRKHVVVGRLRPIEGNCSLQRRCRVRFFEHGFAIQWNRRRRAVPNR